MLGLKPARLWSRDCNTQGLILHPGLALSVLRASSEQCSGPAHSPCRLPQSAVSLADPALRPSSPPSDRPHSPSPQTHHRLFTQSHPPHPTPLTPQHTHPEETPPVRAHSEVRRQIREQRLSLSRS